MLSLGGPYDTLPVGAAYEPATYTRMQTLTFLSGPGLWPLPGAVRDAVLLQYHESLADLPHNLTFQNAFSVTAAPGGGSQVLHLCSN